MLSSSLYTILKLSKTTSPNKLFDYECVTLYTTLFFIIIMSMFDENKQEEKMERKEATLYNIWVKSKKDGELFM